MSEWTETDRRIGMWSATCAATIGLLFVIVGLIGVFARPASFNRLSQVDPYLAMLEVLMILFTVALVSMMAALHAYAPFDRRTFALSALVFVMCFAVLTCSVHFARLTIGRQTDAQSWPLFSHQLSSSEWPALAMSLDLLAWDFFLGLALLFAARVFSREEARLILVSMNLAGALCLTGTLGPATGQMNIQYFGIAGYAFVLPVSCALVALLFRRVRPTQ